MIKRIETVDVEETYARIREINNIPQNATLIEFCLLFFKFFALVLMANFQRLEEILAGWELEDLDDETEYSNESNWEKYEE